MVARVQVRALVAISGAVWAMTACTAHDRATRSQADLLATAADSVLKGAGVHCMTGVVATLDGPHGPDRVVNACLRRVGDTAKYVYRDSSGRTLAVGSHIRVGPERLTAAIESLRLHEVAVRGQSARCSNSVLRKRGVRRYGWDLDSIIVTLWADSAPMYTAIGIEIRRGTRYCDDPLGEPIAR